MLFEVRGWNDKVRKDSKVFKVFKDRKNEDRIKSGITNKQTNKQTNKGTGRAMSKEGVGCRV